MPALADAGASPKFIALQMQCSVQTVRRWLERSRRKLQLCDRPRSGRPLVYGEEVMLRVIAFYCQSRPFAAAGQHSFRWAALLLKQEPALVGASPSKSSILRILRRHKIKPHLSAYFLHITDPDFFPKFEHLLALYFNPPPYLFFFDECPGIQVLKRLVADLRSDNTKKRLKEFEYIRNGTLDVFAFLEHTSGKVMVECQADHTIDTFLKVFKRHVAAFPLAPQLHYVMDNLASHSSYPFCQLVAQLSGVTCPPESELHRQAQRRAWLGRKDKRIIIHFTPFHGSWLNLVEIWFGILGAKVLGDSFFSPDDLKQAIEAFVEQWNLLFAHPFNWSYDGKGLHEKVVRRFIRAIKQSPRAIELRTLTKSLKLMTNLMSNYRGEVPVSLWDSLADTMTLQRDAITSFIDEDDGPRRKLQGHAALDELMVHLLEHLDAKPLNQAQQLRVSSTNEAA